MGLRASKQGQIQIRAALAREGLGIQDADTLKRLERAAAQSEITFSQETWKRFVYANQRIRRDTFKWYCQFLKLNWQDIAEKQAILQSSTYDWDSAPIEPRSGFYGRAAELERIRQTLLSTHCRLVILYGLGGIGKTTLAREIVEQIKGEFAALVWQPFCYGEPIAQILIELIDRLSMQDAIYDTMLANPQQQLSSRRLEDALFKQLHERRVLIVLDEQNFVELDQAEYRSQLSQYRSLLQRLSTRSHRSCILATTREKPSDITALAGVAVSAYQLHGLDAESCSQLLETKGLIADQRALQELAQRYSGNPLALKLIASTIRDAFDGNVKEFLRHTVFVPDPVELLLEKQWKYLNQAERAVLRHLAVTEPLNREELRQSLADQIDSSTRYIKALASLERRSLLAKVSAEHQVLYTLQPMVKRTFRKYAV